MNLNQEHLFDDYFDTINLNDELKSFYQIINDSELSKSFIEATELTKLRNENSVSSCCRRYPAPSCRDTPCPPGTRRFPPRYR